MKDYILRILSCALFLAFAGCGSDRDSYEIGVDPLWYPWNFMNNDNNILGFSTELLKEIGKEEQIGFSLLYTNTDSLLSGLDAGTYEGVLTSLQPYNFTRNHYDFSETYLPLGPVLLLPVSSPYRSLADIQNKQVAVLTGSRAILVLETYPGILPVLCDSPGDVLNLLESGQAVAALLPSLTAKAYARGTFQGRFFIASPPLNKEGLRLVTRKGAKRTLIKRFNKGLQKLEKNGGYENLLKEWNLQTPSREPTS